MAEYNGLLAGLPLGALDPYGPMTRGEIAQVLHTVIGKMSLVQVPVGLEKIQHFVFIMQENRSFDSYFGTYPGRRRHPARRDRARPQRCPVAPFHDTERREPGRPSRLGQRRSRHRRRQDGRLRAQSYKSLPRAPKTPTGTTRVTGRSDVMGYHDYHEIPNYWNYAQLYVLQDHMFESVASYSLPAHLYMLAAQSGGYVGYKGQPEPTSLQLPGDHRAAGERQDRLEVLRDLRELARHRGRPRGGHHPAAAAGPAQLHL